jgi:hypothetical protein
LGFILPWKALDHDIITRYVMPIMLAFVILTLEQFEDVIGCSFNYVIGLAFLHVHWHIFE